MAKMVSRILEQEEAIRVVPSADRKTSQLVPTWQDVDVLQSIHQALSPLPSLTYMLSGEEYVTVSAVLPMLKLIDDNLLKEEDSNTQLTKDIKQRIKLDLGRRYADSEEIVEILKVTTFLDPRFKTKYIKDTVLEMTKQKLVDETRNIQDCTSQSIPTREAADPPPPKKRNLGTMFKQQKEGQEQLPILSVEQQITTDLTCYTSAPMLDSEEDPLVWWKFQSKNYPILSKLAKKYLAVCATSAASERLFSTSGKVVSPLRASLKPEKVEMLVFLSKNL